jgi:hypothetical protein
VATFGLALIFAAALTSPSPSPVPSSPPDPCGESLLATLNRPSVGFATCSVKPGQNVDELGYQNTVGGVEHLTMYPEGFLRFGAAANLELDLIGPQYGTQAVPLAHQAGAFDSGFGAKYEFWHDDTRALAADFLYTLPTGARTFTAGAPIGTLNIDYSMPISSKLGFASTLGAQSNFATALDGATAGRFFSLLPSALISDQWNPRAQVFLEAFGQTRLRPDGGSLFGMDAAMQYLLTPRLEVDVEAGRAVTPISHVHYIGFGFGTQL